MAKSSISHMRRSSVGEESHRSAVTYQSNVTSIQASVGGDRVNKVTPVPKRQFETLDINKIKKQKQNDDDCISAFSKAITTVRQHKGKNLNDRKS
jgi:uncharacterized Zn finger protein